MTNHSDPAGNEHAAAQEFEAWLRTVCFQAPTKEAYDLAKSAWKQARTSAASLTFPLPSIPEDLSRKIQAAMREDRRELVEALREARPYILSRAQYTHSGAHEATKIIRRIDALLAKEESHGNT
jgi:hypothetical protein